MGGENRESSNTATPVAHSCKRGRKSSNPPVFDAARTHDADTALIGYGDAKIGGGRIESALDELTYDLPCGFLVFDGQVLALSDVLVPTAGGPLSDLSVAEIGNYRVSNFSPIKNR